MLAKTNALAYYEHSLITDVKSFITLGPAAASVTKKKKLYDFDTKELNTDVVRKDKEEAGRQRQAGRKEEGSEESFRKRNRKKFKR